MCDWTMIQLVFGTFIVEGFMRELQKPEPTCIWFNGGKVVERDLDLMIRHKNAGIWLLTYQEVMVTP